MGELYAYDRSRVEAAALHDLTEADGQPVRATRERELEPVDTRRTSLQVGRWT